jgi:tetratricopeptide (TPR) repeat protein
MLASRTSLAFVLCLVIACGATLAEEPEGNSAPNYHSNAAEAAQAIPSAAGRMPEDDARPGEYYFKLGANAFQHKDYAHAVKMYEVAASWAYKPAQFNLGVMYARGQGVPVDLPRAMAWMALAAERNDQEYVDAKEVVYSAMSKEQFEQANALWRELKKTYGDDVAMPRAKARWAEVRNNATGSHVGAAAGPLLVGATPAHVAKLPPTTAGGGAPPHMATEGADVFAGGDRTDGSTAYKQLRESNNPYDPKFTRPEVGIATVEPLQPVKNEKPDENSKPVSDGTPAH